jgi:hypothetical protein
VKRHPQVIGAILGASLLGLVPSTASAEIATATANIRSGPGVGNPIVGVLRPGERVDVRRCVNADRWCLISRPGPDGWVAARFLGVERYPRFGFQLQFPDFDLRFGTPPRGDVDPPRRTRIVRGVLTDEGVECQAMRGDNGRLYTLVGNTGRFDTGDRVVVRGRIAQSSTCMQGTTLQVRSIRGG